MSEIEIRKERRKPGEPAVRHEIIEVPAFTKPSLNPTGRLELLTKWGRDYLDGIKSLRTLTGELATQFPISVAVAMVERLHATFKRERSGSNPKAKPEDIGNLLFGAWEKFHEIVGEDPEEEAEAALRLSEARRAHVEGQNEDASAEEHPSGGETSAEGVHSA